MPPLSPMLAKSADVLPLGDGSGLSVFAQPGFGVVVIQPQVGDEGRMSTGPKQPTPTVAGEPLAPKNSTARRRVSAGVVVGKISLAAMSRPPFPTAHTQRVPPASMPP